MARALVGDGVSIDLDAALHLANHVRWTHDHAARDPFGINACRCIAVCQRVRLPVAQASLDQQAIVIGGEPYLIVHRERVVPMLGVHGWWSEGHAPDPYIQPHVELMEPTGG